MRFILGLIIAAGFALAAPASAAELFEGERVVAFGGPIYIYTDHRRVQGLARFVEVRRCPVTLVKQAVGAVTVIYNCPHAW